ncbi:hypothetical protein [Paracoccus sp. ME4]|uniref:hypothetical protein n=1 Tax=Paracoccus sp. ME4 TaxID=3138066 RepID=UPI00398BB3B0
MQTLSPSLITALQAARDAGIAPVYFVWIEARSRATGAIESMGLWSGDEDAAFSVETPTGGTASREYLGGVNLEVDSLKSVADLTDEPVTISMSQIAGATQQLVRGTDVRLACVEIHATSRVGGALASIPQLQWIGIVDDVQIATPQAGGDGRIGLTVRSEIMSQLLAVNPAKSSDSHQKRRQAGDEFSKYSASVQARKIQWYKKDQ